jgi:hypothetical protein
VTINGENDAPSFVRAISSPDGTAFTVAAADLLANDSDIEGRGPVGDGGRQFRQCNGVAERQRCDLQRTSAGAASFDYTVSDTSGGQSRRCL